MVQLVASLRRFVRNPSFLSPSLPISFSALESWLIWILCIGTALTFVVAPLPNALFSHCGGGEDFSAADYGENSGPIDLGRFITAFIVVTGFSLPLVLAHSEIIKPGASIMSLIGGGYVRSCSAASVLRDNRTLTQLPRAVSCMAPSRLTLQRSGKTILNTSSPSCPQSRFQGLRVSNSYMT
jgi:hypothetical protein